jgi:hypothetical protein
MTLTVMDNLNIKRQQFTEFQMFVILKEGESGTIIVPDLCQQHGCIRVITVEGH